MLFNKMNKMQCLITFLQIQQAAKEQQMLTHLCSQKKKKLKIRFRNKIYGETNNCSLCDDERNSLLITLSAPRKDKLEQFSVKL